MVIPAVLVAAAIVPLVACTAGAADRSARALPADCRAPALYVALGDSTVEGIGATSPAQNYRWAELMWTRVEPLTAEC